MRLFISTGEPSGDLHAANLVRALRRKHSSVDVVGFGGPQMQSAGCELIYPLTDLALMWFARVAVNLHRFADLVAKADRAMRRRRPDAVIVIDYPGFNWWIARRAHAQGIPVFYYVPPQLWAWASWRVRKMRAWVDHVLCTLPFEKPWYEARGVPATYIGHPYFDELVRRSLDARFMRDTAGVASEPPKRLAPPRPRAQPIIALLPGSRRQEVTANFPTMLRVAQRLHRELHGARFLVACQKDEHRRIIRAMTPSDAPLELFVGRTAEIIHLADVALAVSGSVGLELLQETTPTIVLYQVTSRLVLRVGLALKRCRFVSLVNLLADEDLFPEFVSADDESGPISQVLLNWLRHEDRYADCVHRLAALKARVALPGACDRAADYILTALSRPAASRPHFLAERAARAATPADAELGGLP